MTVEEFLFEIYEGRETVGDSLEEIVAATWKKATEAENNRCAKLILDIGREKKNVCYHGNNHAAFMFAEALKAVK